MSDHLKRVAALRREIVARKLDSFFVTDEINVSYLSGFRGHDSMLFLTPKRSFLITDSRYAEEAGERVKGYEVVLVKQSTFETVRRLAEMRGLRRIGFESMNLPYAVAARLKEMLSPAKLVPVRDLIETIRSIKTGAEISLIRDSIRLTKEVLAKVAGKISKGVTEEALSRFAERSFLMRGARASFEPIIAHNKNSSKPHARPTGARITGKGFVMVDIGCNLNGYNSDMTRMMVMGKVPEKFKRIYDIVRQAQKRALAKIRPGAVISDIDGRARTHIKNNGFGKYFGHALGHGIGMAVHEHPTVSKINTGLLKPGMVFTVEPAIYIPGFGGARIEDIVLVTNNGHEVLTA